MDSRKVRIGTYLYEQSLYLVVSGFSRSAMRLLMSALSCYCALWATPLFARNAALVQDQPPVTQEIRYHMPEAGEVFLVWGVDGWKIVPEAQRPAGTFVQGAIMYTPMIQDSMGFKVNIQGSSPVTDQTSEPGTHLHGSRWLSTAAAGVILTAPNL